MNALFAPVGRALSFIGRNGTVFFAASVFLGLALPQLSSVMRPMLAISAFVFIMLNFARTDAESLRSTLVRPGRLALATLWTVGSMPLLLLLLFAVLPRDHWDPDVVLALALYAGAPALMGAPAYASLFGFRNGLIIAILFISMCMAPVLSPVLVTFLAGKAIPLDPFELGRRLFFLIGGSILAGIVLRRLAGYARLVAWKHQLNGIGVICFFLFAIAAMDGVIASAVAEPHKMLMLLALSFTAVVIGQGLTLMTMNWLGPNDVFTLSLGTGLRNIGLLIATLGAATPRTTYLFFAMIQFPVYMAPLLASPIARIFARRARQAESDEERRMPAS